MSFICMWDSKKKKKGRNAPTHEAKNTPVGCGERDIAHLGETRVPIKQNEIKTDNSAEKLTGVSFSDIIALNREFREAFEENLDYNSKRYFLNTMKLVAAEMMLRKVKAKNVNVMFPKAAFVQRLLKEPQPVRARLALAIQRFCSVVEQEIENEELMRETGLLESICGSIKQAVPPSSTDGHVDKANTIAPPENFDALKIYYQLMNTDELPSLEEMGELMRRASQVLKKEANIVMVSLPCVVVGDIHGQKQDLLRSIIAAGGPLHVDCQGDRSPDEEDMEVVGKRNYLFLGDYVDRGSHSLQCVALLFAAKILAPHHVFLLRGNHESSETNSRYGFLQECYECYPLASEENGGDNTNSDCFLWDLKEHPLWSLANDAFNNLPLCAVVTNADQQTNEGEHNIYNSSKHRVAICAMHGGLSPFISDSLDGILAIDRFRIIERGPLADITWADPVVTRPSVKCAETSENANGAQATAETEVHQDRRLVRHCVAFDYDEPVPLASARVGYSYSARGRGHNFGEDVTLRFLQENELNFIVRAHQCVQEGYEWQHHKRLLTVFSAPNYCGLGNKGAILILHASGEPELVQFKALDGIATADMTPAPVPPMRF